MFASLILALLSGCGTSEPPWPKESSAPPQSAVRAAAPETATETATALVTPPPSPGGAGSALGRLPLAFEKNQGQFDPQALFAVRHAAGTFFFTADSLAAVFTRTIKTADREPNDQHSDLPGDPDPADHPAGHLGEPGGPGRDTPAATERFALKIHFVGASGTAAVEGVEPLQGKVNSFRGKVPEGWVSGAATFGRIVYRGLWPGVDVSFSGTAGRLNAQYHLHRAADAGLIQLRYVGQDGLNIDRDGRLVIATPWGDLHEEAPTAEQNGHPVDISFTLDESKAEVGFRLEGADPDAPLVINPQTAAT